MPADKTAKSDTSEPSTDPTSTADDTMGHKPPLLDRDANLADHPGVLRSQKIESG
jgi:hypothetical protein